MEGCKFVTHCVSGNRLYKGDAAGEFFVADSMETDEQPLFLVVDDYEHKMYVAYNPSSKHWHHVEISFVNVADSNNSKSENFVILASDGGLILLGKREDDTLFTGWGGRKLKNTFIVVNPVNKHQRLIDPIPGGTKILYIDLALVFMLEDGMNYYLFLAERGEACDWICRVFDSGKNSWEVSGSLKMKKPGVFCSCARHAGLFYCLTSDISQFHFYRVGHSFCEELKEDRPRIVNPDSLSSPQLFESQGRLMLGGVSPRGSTVCMWEYNPEGDLWEKWKHVDWVTLNIADRNSAFLREREIPGMGVYPTTGLDVTFYSKGDHILIAVISRLMFGGFDDLVWTIMYNVMEKRSWQRRCPPELSGWNSHPVANCLFQPRPDVFP